MTINAFMLEPIKKLSQHYQVHIIFNGNAEEMSPDLEIAGLIPVRIERKISPWQDLLALLRLIKIFRSHNFEIVQSVTPKAGLLAMMASFFAGVKIRSHIFTGQIWVTRRGMNRWVFKQVDRLIAMLATDVLVDSVSQRQFLLDENVVSASRSVVLAKGSIAGVDIERFKPDVQLRAKVRQELEYDADNTVFLFIGRLNRDKGVLDLATAFARINESRARLLIVGPDEAGMQAQMERILANCVNRVHFVGYSAHPEIYMAAADVLCLPSYREGFGSVVLEAAAVGIPAIGSRIYGVEDSIVDGQTGLLFSAGNIEELQHCLQAIIDDGEMASRFGETARTRVAQEFSSEILASAWLDYYQANL